MEKIQHGTIITGADGGSLLTEARRLSAAVLCEKSVNGEGCGVCRHCKKALEGIHPDVTLIERETGTENRLRKDLIVDQIRRLEKDSVVLPNEAERKVYIIKEAELLNENAQNAFLKLLEEPPSFVWFLLCADNPSRLLPTIRSRCAVHRVRDEAEEGDGYGKKLCLRYLEALGDDAAMLSVTSELERMESAEFRAFVDTLRLTAAEKLKGQELLSLERELEHLWAMLRVNVSVRHAAGLLATYRYEP